MASQTDVREPEVPFFTGKSAEEAEDFIQAVNWRAYAAGKHKDNAWIADFAYPFFSRKALRWYDTLDEQTQNDWRLLRSAIWAEFTEGQPAPSAVPSAALAGNSSSLRYTPAAPPPPAVTKLVGRIRVDSKGSDKQRYLKILSTGTAFGVLCENIQEARVFEVDISDQTLKVQGEEDGIVIKQYSMLSPGQSDYGCITRSSVDLGAQWINTWAVSNRNEVTNLLHKDGSQWDAQFLISSLNPGSIIHVPANLQGFLEKYSYFTLVTLHFEPIS